MCGRYSSTQTDAEIVKEFGVQEVVGEEPRPSWNVAPTQSRRVVLEHAPRDADESELVPRMLRSCRWGLLPSWAKDVKIGARLINARSETLTETFGVSSCVRALTGLPRLRSGQRPLIVKRCDQHSLSDGGAPKLITGELNRASSTAKAATRRAGSNAFHASLASSAAVALVVWMSRGGSVGQFRPQMLVSVDRTPDLARGDVREFRPHPRPSSVQAASPSTRSGSTWSADSTIRNDSDHLELIRQWFERPLWEMEPADADVYFGRHLRAAAPATRTWAADTRTGRPTPGGPPAGAPPPCSGPSTTTPTTSATTAACDHDRSAPTAGAADPRVRSA
jgi:hypothetical protein